MEGKTKYFLGADISTHAFNRVYGYRKGLLGHTPTSKEAHLTILPPFWATYEEASEINRGCALASIKSDHPMHTTVFEMRGLDILTFEGEDFIVFPVTPYSQGEDWGGYIQKVRTNLLKGGGLSYVEPIPEEYRPHVTGCSRKQLHQRLPVGKVIEESRKERPLMFSITFLSLYAKYKDGYKVLSSDPTR